MIHLIRQFLHKYIYEDWNVAVGELSSESLVPHNIRWMKHDYTDRWFADPFIIDVTDDSYIILAEECIHGHRGRLARLTIRKSDCHLVGNETVLDIDTHLSFPNFIEIEGKVYVYPENASSGNTRYYEYGDILRPAGVISEEGLADPVIVQHEGLYYLLATLPPNVNGHVLTVFQSKEPLSGYKKVQEVMFEENIARRAGNVFEWQRTLISPAQVCNKAYGEGVSLQNITFDGEQIYLEEIERIMPPTHQYPEGFHTYNVFTANRQSTFDTKLSASASSRLIALDGYRFGSPILHRLYFSMRK